MDTQNNGTLIVLDAAYLSALDKTQLADLLQHKTKLLVVASKTHLVNQEYFDELKKEVQLLYAELCARRC